MSTLRYTKHAEGVGLERDIPETWVDRILSEPELVEEPGDGTIHYIAPIVESEGRFTCGVR